MKVLLICLLAGAFLAWFFALIALLMSKWEYSIAKKTVQLFIGGSVLTAVFIGLLYLCNLVEAMR